MKRVLILTLLTQGQVAVYFISVFNQKLLKSKKTLTLTLVCVETVLLYLFRHTCHSIRKRKLSRQINVRNQRYHWGIGRTHKHQSLSLNNVVNASCVNFYELVITPSSLPCKLVFDVTTYNPTMLISTRRFNCTL